MQGIGGGGGGGYKGGGRGEEGRRGGGLKKIDVSSLEVVSRLNSQCCVQPFILKRGSGQHLNAGL